MVGCGRRGPAAVGAVAVASRVLPVGPSDAAEEALDLLNGLAEHRLAEQNVHPGVEDGVDRSNTDGLQVWVLLDGHHYGRLVELVHKDTHLKGRGDS